MVMGDHIMLCVDQGAKKEEEATCGVDEFWLIALKNCEIFADVIKVVIESGFII